jgi:PmbA protein
VRAAADLLLAALHSAGEALSGCDVRFEAFARLGESVHIHRERDGSLERRSSREFGVACRVAGDGRAGFAAASGSGARAGRDAARAALGTMRAAPDPLPPRSLLGSSGTALPFQAPDAGQLAALVEDVASRFAAANHGLALVQLRGLAGSSAAALATGDGFHALASAGGAVLELLVAPGEGPWRHFHFAAPALADFDPAAVAERAREAALLATRGRAPERQLADVILAPAVAAPLVAALAQRLTATAGPLGAARVSRAWRLVDDRPGPAGLLPLPWDGEGLPARRIELIAGGEVRERLATWADAERTGGAPGGAVRPSYRHPPHAGPANLVVLPEPALQQAELLARVEHGFYLAVPAGAVRLDAASGRFELRAAAVAVRHGKPATAHPLVTVRGSLRRLLGGLLATGGDSESFSLACAVTTPSLLFRRLEIA